MPMRPRQDVGARKNPESEQPAEDSDKVLNPQSRAHKANVLSDFRLVQKLGEGGMGTVYKAHQLSLNRTVAVKVPFKHLARDPAFVQRFVREARIMARLDHLNIVRVYEVGEENGWQYLAMEYIDGASMQTWLEKLGRLSVADSLLVILDCAQALQHAHELGMVHRDIKPDDRKDARPQAGTSLPELRRPGGRHHWHGRRQ